MKLSAVGQALGDGRREDRARARARDLRRGPGRSAPPSPSTWRTTPPPTRRSASCASCEPTSRTTAAVLQAYLHRTEGDCRDLARRGQPGAVVQGRLRRARLGRLHQNARTSTAPTCAARTCCWRATGTRCSPPTTRRSIEIGGERAKVARQVTGGVRAQMLYGIRPDEQRRLAAARAHRAGVRALRRAVVRLPDAAAGRATRQPRVLRCARWSRRAEGRNHDRHGRHPRRRQDRRGPAVRAAARRTRARRHRRRREAPRPGGLSRRDVRRAGRSTWPSAAADRAQPSSSRSSRRTSTPARRTRRGRSTPAHLVSRSRPASRPRTSNARCPTGWRWCGACRTPRRSSTRR